jgi:phospholipase/carboxylesterase
MSGRSDKLVILLHGRGGVEDDLTALQAAIPPPWRSILLQAPLPLGEGFEWFRVPDDAASGPPSRSVAPAADRLVEWITEHAPDAAVGLVGYSQGGAVALQALRRYPHRFEFVAVFAGFTTVDEEATDEELAGRRPPVLWCRGTEDRVIPDGDIVRMRQFLPSHTTLVERIYPGADHEVTPQMAHDLTDFIAGTTKS